MIGKVSASVALELVADTELFHRAGTVLGVVLFGRRGLVGLLAATTAGEGEGSGTPRRSAPSAGSGGLMRPPFTVIEVRAEPRYPLTAPSITPETK